MGFWGQRWGESPSPDWKNILFWQLGRRNAALCMFPIWSKLPTSFCVQCWCQAGTWFPPWVCCTFLEREKHQLLLFEEEMLWSFGCHSGVQNLLLHSTPFLPCGALWEDSQAPCTLISFCPVDQPFAWGLEQSSNRTSLCFQILRRVFWPTLASWLCSSPPATAGAIRVPSFSPPHHAWHRWASLPLLVFAPSLLASLLSFCLNWRGSGKLN